MKINNKALNKLFLKIRLKGPTVLIAAQEFRTRVHHIFNQQYALGLVGDQNPGAPQVSYWLNFFGQPVPFVTGPDKGLVDINWKKKMIKGTFFLILPRLL